MVRVARLIIFTCWVRASCLPESAAPPSALDLSPALVELLASTGEAFERRWRHTLREAPLVPIDLTDVEAWLSMGGAVRPHDIEIFSEPPKEQAGVGGDFKGDPRPVPIAGRLEYVRKEFGAGRSLVFNSIHRWCPKAAALASQLQKLVGLPVDVYMYLTPPYSHSYGLHSDVMDAFMMQLVGRKHWSACEGSSQGAPRNCSDALLQNGDVLYLPLGAKHKAWTGDQLSAHLTVNVERQFYVWGSVLQALSCKLLLKGDQLEDLRAFAMEGQDRAAQQVELAASELPELLRMPSAMFNYTRKGAAVTGGSMLLEWKELLASLEATKVPGKFHLDAGGKRRTFASLAAAAQKLRAVADEKTVAALDWIGKLMQRNIGAMHDEHGGVGASQTRKGAATTHSQEQQLEALAARRSAAVRERLRRDGGREANTESEL